MEHVVNRSRSILFLLLLGVAAHGMREAKVSDFGAVPDDGLDDSAAFQQALDFVMADGGGYLFVPPGDYRIDSCLSVRVPNAANASVSIPLQLRGAGQGSSRLIGSDPGGLLWFETTANGMNLTVRDLSLLADAPDCGPALVVLNPELGVRAERGFVAERLEIGRTAPSNSFSKGIFANGQWRALLRNISITGGDPLPAGNKIEAVLFDEHFYIDLDTRYESWINVTTVGSSETEVTPFPLRFGVAEGDGLFSPRYGKPGGELPGDGSLLYNNSLGNSSIVSIDFDEFDEWETLTLTTRLSAFDTGGMAIGFGAEPDAFFADDDSALWIASDGGTSTVADVDVALYARVDGTNTLLETLAGRDRPNADDDTVTLVYNRAGNTVSGVWNDGSNGLAAFQTWKLDAIGFVPRFRRVKYEVRDEKGLHSNFPRIGYTGLVGRSPRWPMARGIDMDGFYGGDMLRCAVTNAHTAYDLVTDGVGEGGSVMDSTVVGCAVGIVVSTPGQEPGAHFSGNTIRAAETGIRLVKKRVGVVADNLIEPLNPGEPFTDIELYNCLAIQLSGNRLLGSADNRLHLLVDGHGSEPLPYNAIRTRQIDFHGNTMVLPIGQAVRFQGTKIYEIHLDGNTIEAGGAQ